MTTAQPMFTVLSGHPDDVEIAALDKVLHDVARRSSGPQERERNDWGRTGARRLHVAGFNPAAFRTLTYR
ncbi:acyl-CoA carboxylase subunit epsilon [Corynebacterium frankenforstense]|uniref:acyl-CoA carboxylase subunit epsilon n=1 Tax=Corynebacterium frankenforstense TaxID=1230998 RepID=UPI0026ED3FF3|nr:acyl-CoA carboxylase subunit epsilon [Corynebacterium frankenforstense]